MADKYLSFKEFKQLLYDITLAITAYDPSWIRHAYQTKGQPSQDVDEDRVYIYAQPGRSPYSERVETLIEHSDVDHATLRRHYTRSFNVMFSFYGPSANDMADKFRSRILAFDIKGLLSAKDVYPVPHIQEPVKLQYEQNGQFFDRLDVHVSFYVDTVREEIVPYIKGIGIVLVHENGQRTDIDI